MKLALNFPARNAGPQTVGNKGKIYPTPPPVAFSSLQTRAPDQDGVTSCCYLLTKLIHNTSVQQVISFVKIQKPFSTTF